MSLAGAYCSELMSVRLRWTGRLFNWPGCCKQNFWRC